MFSVTAEGPISRYNCQTGTLPAADKLTNPRVLKVDFFFFSGGAQTNPNALNPAGKAEAVPPTLPEI